ELHWSEWDNEDFTIDVELPAVPTFALTPQAGFGRIEVACEEGAGGDVSTDYIQVQRSDDGGLTWANIRTAEGEGVVAVSGGAATAYDFEAANGALVHYRARALHAFSSGTLSMSAWTVPASTKWQSSEWWIKHPTRPELNLSMQRARV